MRCLVLVFLIAAVVADLGRRCSELNITVDEDDSWPEPQTTARTRLRHSRHLDNQPAKLEVKDNHKPIFKDCAKYHPSVKEEQPIGTYVMTVEAVDRDPPDRGGSITYNFISTFNEKERFKVDPVTGIITTVDIFDHDEPAREKEVYITVRATDNGQPELDDACTIKIKIEDINDNQPVFDKVTYMESVPQDLPVGRPVMRISATDIDEGDNSIVRYQLDTNSPDQQYFYIDKDNGLIFLNRSIDKPAGYKFHLSAVVTDKGEPPLQSSMTLDIAVVESNKKPPSFTEVPREPIRLKESYANFTHPITILKAQSNIEDEDKLQFELVMGQTEQTNKQHTFVLEPDANTAYLKLGHRLDYERITDYTLTVRVLNNYRLAAETIIYIKIEDVNDNIPIFSEIRSGTVLENEPIGTPVMQVRAIDADATSANNQVTYALEDPTNSFDIDPLTGNITTRVMLDRENRSYYSVKVFATDNSESALIPKRNNTGQHVFLIEIADKNDNPPQFTQDTYVTTEVAESANINELVTQVAAIDNDTASVVTYSIISGNTYDAFSITNYTGEIRVKNPLDYENITSYTLDVRATDGIFDDYAKIIISVLNINDNPPVFVANYSKTIQEETEYNGCVVKVEAYDPDLTNRTADQGIVYSLIKQEQKEFLKINRSGCLELTKPLDRDPPLGFAHWQIFIMAVDQAGDRGSESLRSTTEVLLELTDINDNAPYLVNSQPVIWYENEPPGPIALLTARDNDSLENGPPFTFAINETLGRGLDYRTKFSITGDVLSSLVSFDRENIKEYNIPIAITDSGSPRLTGVSFLRVIIGDTNDNPMHGAHSNIFVYNFRGETPDTEIGRVYVKDPDDWDTADKDFMWLPSFEKRSPNFDVYRSNGMIIMKRGTPAGTYALTFNVTEQSRNVPFHSVVATVNVTVKDIPEKAVDNSGSIRFMNISAESFIIPEFDGLSKREKLHRRLAKIFNTSLDNVDVFSVITKNTNSDKFLDVRFSAHGSPYYTPEKLHVMVSNALNKIEEELKLKVYMVNINECLLEKVNCPDSCRNILNKSNLPASIYTNTTSFVGVTVYIDPDCQCMVPEAVCLNGGTPFADKCECPEGLTGPRCESTKIGFSGDGWAIYPPLQTCLQGRISLTVTTNTPDCLILYMGPLRASQFLRIADFISLELLEGHLVLMMNYGSGTTRINNSVITVSDGNPHLIEVTFTKTTIELFVDDCHFTSCMALGAPIGPSEHLNVNGPIFMGGVSVDLQEISDAFNWSYVPSNRNMIGCISNFTYNDQTYNLGMPSYHLNAVDTCTLSYMSGVMFFFHTNFIATVIACLVVLIALLLLVVVHKKRKDNWAEKELDDIRENIIAYEDEGGGEGDAGYDLHVLRQMFQPQPEGDNYMRGPVVVAPAAPDISNFLDDKKSILDRDSEICHHDDVRHYAYEGDGNTSGSLSSLASCTDDGDLKFNYLSTFGPRFRKLADMYGDSDEERAGPHEESWC
ncbi:DE-cadherin isoform X2 [Hyposmocoma kahamanoa]|uniref:DE-cadherin isoform X2 n=1 Tax=Hyposmocoma kahamanoa TaxID=1477025 RepID=UPI000E6D705F|nr:DE-cadherin isoform X2 [Hyposmocoma kahamanoa]